MTEYTRHNNYPFPEINTKGWDRDLRLSIQQIDADMATALDQSGGSQTDLEATTSFQLPVYADINEYPAPDDGDMAYVSGTGTLTEGIYTYDGSAWVGPLTDTADTTTAQAWTELSDVEVGTLSNRPTAGTAGLWYFTTDNNGAYYDTGSQWDKVLLNPGGIAVSDLAFDPATQTELSEHSSQNGVHHQRYADSEAQSAVEGFVDAGDLAGGGGVAGQALHTDGNQAYWTDSDGNSGVQLQEGTITHTTGSHTTFSIDNLTDDERVHLSLSMAPATSDQVSGNYAFNTSWSQRWDASIGAVILDGIINWDIDPGTDMEFAYTVRAL